MYNDVWGCAEILPFSVSKEKNDLGFITFDLEADILFAF